MLAGTALRIMDDFRAWFVAGGGIIHPDVEIASDSTGFHLRARSAHDIAPASALITCPHRLMISWPQVLHGRDGRDGFLTRLDGRRASAVISKAGMMRLFLMREYLLQEKSFWWPYIRSLPQPDSANRLGTPLWYGREERVWIRGTNLEFGAETKERMWREEYEEGMRCLLPADDDPAERCSWSWSVKLGRQVHGAR